MLYKIKIFFTKKIVFALLILSYFSTGNGVDISQYIDNEENKIQSYEFNFENEDLSNRLTQDTNIFFFNIQEGNFIMGREKEDIYIFDAGSGKLPCGSIFSYFFSGDICPRMHLLKNILSEETKIKIICITHTDADHYNFLHHIKKTFNHVFDENTVLIIGGEKHNKVEDLIKLSGIDKKNVFLYQQKEPYNDLFFEKSLEKSLNVSLIPYKSINFLIPNQQKISENKNTTTNDMSLILVFNRTLITGDSTGKTAEFYEFQQNELNKEILKKIIGIVAPHHGSDTKESHTIIEKVEEIKKLLFIIISVSARHSIYKHPATYLKNFAKEDWGGLMNPEWEHEVFTFDNGKLASIMTKNAIFETGSPEYIPAHWINSRDGKIYIYNYKEKCFSEITPRINQ